MAEIRNPFEHHHDHGHDHAHEYGQALPAAELDPAQRSLADALRVSFGILKLVMLVLVVLYLVSGITWGIDPQQRAVRLRFGQIVGQSDEESLMLPGKVYFAFPYPIDQVVFVPVSAQKLELSSEFWFAVPPGSEAMTEEDRIQSAGPLNPEKDGSMLTGDGNIIHSRWTIQYHIDRPVDFIRHITAPSADPRQVLAAAQRVVQAAAEESVVWAVAQITAEEAIRGELRAQSARARMQRVLDNLHAGILITEVTPADPRFPLAVQRDFRAVTEAASEKAQKIEAARQEATRGLAETAGAAHEPLRRLIDLYERARAAADQDAAQRIDQRLGDVLDRQQAPAWAALPAAGVEALWDRLAELETAQETGQPQVVLDAKARLDAALAEQGVPVEQRGTVAVGGEVARLVNEARAYRSAVVAELQAEALAFNPRAIDPTTLAQGLLDQYVRSPEVFVSRRWQDMVDSVLSGDIEVFYVPPGQTYLELSRDQSLRKRREQERFKAEQDARRTR